MILVQYFNGAQLATAYGYPIPDIYEKLCIDGKRYLVHWVRGGPDGVEVGVEDITPSGGCSGANAVFGPGGTFGGSTDGGAP